MGMELVIPQHPNRQHQPRRNVNVGIIGIFTLSVADEDLRQIERDYAGCSGTRDPRIGSSAIRISNRQRHHLKTPTLSQS